VSSAGACGAAAIWKFSQTHVDGELSLVEPDVNQVGGVALLVQLPEVVSW
jgi:hypothetical protein